MPNVPHLQSKQAVKLLLTSPASRHANSLCCRRTFLQLFWRRCFTCFSSAFQRHAGAALSFTSSRNQDVRPAASAGNLTEAQTTVRIRSVFFASAFPQQLNWVRATGPVIASPQLQSYLRCHGAAQKPRGKHMHAFTYSERRRLVCGRLRSNQTLSRRDLSTTLVSVIYVCRNIILLQPSA